MKLYIKQKVFSFKDRFTIKNESQEDIYTAVGKLMSLTKKLTVYDQTGQEVIYLNQRFKFFLPQIDVYFHQQFEFSINKKFTFIRQHYEISELPWHVEGDFWAHNYQVLNQSEIIAKISKAFISWGDFYEIDIKDELDTEKVIAIVLAIDIAMTAAKHTHTTGAANHS